MSPPDSVLMIPLDNSRHFCHRRNTIQQAQVNCHNETDVCLEQSNGWVQARGDKVKTHLNQAGLAPSPAQVLGAACKWPTQAKWLWQHVQLQRCGNDSYSLCQQSVRKVSSPTSRAQVQSGFNGGPSRVMSYFSKMAPMTFGSGGPLRAIGPISS